MARTPLYSKGQSIAFLMVLAALTMGGLGEPLNNPGGRRELFVVPVVAVLYVLAGTAVLLTVPATPSADCQINNKSGATMR